MRFWFWLTGLWDIIRRGRLWVAPVLLVIAGCSAAGDFVGSPHGYIGDIKTPIGLNINGVPTIVPEGSVAMGYTNGRIDDAYSTLKTADVTATGIPAIVLACGADQDCIVAALGL